MAKHEQLKMQNLHVLDGGKVAAAFDYHLQAVVRDIQDRTTDPKARKLTMTVTLVPSKEEPDEIVYAFSFASKVPPHQTRAYVGVPHHNGELAFNPDSDHPDQKTLYDDQEREEDGI